MPEERNTLVLRAPYDPDEWKCPRCFNERPVAGQKGRFFYKSFSDLNKHLKLRHPELRVSFGCRACDFVPPTGAHYPRKVAQQHYASAHTADHDTSATLNVPGSRSREHAEERPNTDASLNSRRSSSRSEATDVAASAERSSATTRTSRAASTTAAARSSLAGPSARPSTASRVPATSSSSSSIRSYLTRASTSSSSRPPSLGAVPKRTSTERRTSSDAASTSRRSTPPPALQSRLSGGSSQGPTRLSTSRAPATRPSTSPPAPRTRSRAARGTSEPPSAAPTRTTSRASTLSRPSVSPPTRVTRASRGTSEPPAPARPATGVALRRSSRLASATTTYAEAVSGAAPTVAVAGTRARSARSGARAVQPEPLGRARKNIKLPVCSAPATLTTATVTVSVCGGSVVSPVYTTTTSTGSRAAFLPPPPALPRIEEGLPTIEDESSGDDFTAESTARRRRRAGRTTRRLPTSSPESENEGHRSFRRVPHSPTLHAVADVIGQALRDAAGASINKNASERRSIDRGTSPVKFGPSDANQSTGSGFFNFPPDDIDFIIDSSELPGGTAEVPIQPEVIMASTGGTIVESSRSERGDDGGAGRRARDGRAVPRPAIASPSAAQTPQTLPVNRLPEGPRPSPRAVRRRGRNENRTPRPRAATVSPPRRQPNPEREARAASGLAREQLQAEREELIRLARSAGSSEDLEGLALRVRAYFRKFCPEVRSGAGRDLSRTRGVAGRSRRDQGARGAQSREVAGEGNQVGQPRQGNAVREATRIQRLFRKDRRRAVREILSGDFPHCKVALDEIQRHFTNIYTPRPDREDGLAVDEQSVEAPIEGTNEILAGEFAAPEVDRRLRRMKKSSPGPDGVSYETLKAADSGSSLLTATFNACRRLESTPAAWKESNTVLIHKKGDPGNLSNWRPLAMGDTVPKLFAAVIADRLTEWATKNGRLSPSQKGFLPHEGCYEHNFVLQEAIGDARRRKRKIVVAWLDLSNAFGSVPHSTIYSALERAKVPAALTSIVRSLYTDCSTRVRAEEGFTEPIPMRSGVRQGCPLSPILFNLALEPVIRELTALDAGYELFGHRVTVLAYADDLALVADTPENMRALLRSAEVTARGLGLEFNPAKCATLFLGNGRVASTPFTLQGAELKALDKGEAYEHLGIPTGVGVRQTPYSSIERMIDDVKSVDRSLLAPWQKVETVASFILPRLDFLLRGAHVEKGALKVADKVIKATVKSWLHLPQRASAELVFIPPSWGGCGLMPLADLADVLTIAHAFRMLTARDAVVAAIARASLTRAVESKIRQPPSGEDLADFLSGSMAGALGAGRYESATFWSGVRNACRRSGKQMSSRWRWDEVEDALSLRCRGSSGREITIPASARHQVIWRLRAAVNEHYRERLVTKKDQGKVYDVTARQPVSNHFMRTGSFARFADWRFLHRARLDVLPLNGARRWGEGDKRCRVCGAPNETLPHVLNHCGTHSALRQKRHDAILNRLAKASRIPGELKLNQRVPGVDEEFASLRPDLVVTNERLKTIVIVDVAVPFENKFEAIQAAREEKIRKYSPLADCLRRRGYRVVVDAFLVGALGGWDPANEPVLGMLRVSPRYATLMRRLLVSESIAWSRNIYVQHVSGVPQPFVPQALRSRNEATANP